MAKAQNAVLKTELMNLADTESEESSTKRRKIQQAKSRRDIEAEVQEFMDSLKPSRKSKRVNVERYMTAKTEASEDSKNSGKVKDYAQEIFKLIDSM